MFGLDVGAPPLPEPETRMGFIRRYADDSAKRLALLEATEGAWWAREVAFFDTTHSTRAPSARVDSHPSRGRPRGPGPARKRRPDPGRF